MLSLSLFCPPFLYTSLPPISHASFLFHSSITAHHCFHTQTSSQASPFLLSLFFTFVLVHMSCLFVLLYAHVDVAHREGPLGWHGTLAQTPKPPLWPPAFPPSNVHLLILHYISPIIHLFSLSTHSVSQCTPSPTLSLSFSLSFYPTPFSFSLVPMIT